MALGMLISQAQRLDRQACGWGVVASSPHGMACRGAGRLCWARMSDLDCSSSEPALPRGNAPLTAKPEGQWRHGNLREALIQLGTQVLDAEGSEALSLRSLAKLAGVSPGAPAHHFGDKNGLLAAIAAQGFRDLVAMRQVSLAAVPAHDAEGRLRVLLLSHFAFAKAHPARFHLMYGPRLAHMDDYPELKTAGTISFAMLREAVAALASPDRDPGRGGLSDDELSHMVWACVHGVSMLRLNRLAGPVRQTPPQRGSDLGETMVRFCLLAIRG